MFKVCHLITELAIGGAQTALYRLLAGLDRSQFTCQVLCLYNGDKTVAQQIRALGIPVTDLGMSRKWRLDALGRLFSVLRQQKPDILHTWMFHANIPGRVLGHWARVPHIVSGERTMGQELGVRLTLNRLTARYAQAITCVSAEVAHFAQHTIGLPAAKLHTIPNGLDLKAFQNLPSPASARQTLQLPPHALVVGAIGRPRPVKGFNFLLEAWPAVLQAVPQAHLVFIGDGPDRPALEQQSRQLNLQNQVTFAGDQTNIPHLLPALNLLALPSLHEGMPNVALEAMAAALPVVATAVGGTPEVVLDGQTGFLVPPQNPSALSAKIIELLTNPALAHQLGTAGQQRVQTHFSLTTTIQQTEKLYHQLLQL